MSARKFLSVAGVTPAKLVLIGVLAVVLLVVIVLQLPKSRSSAQPQRPAARNPAADEAPSRNPTNPQDSNEQPARAEKPTPVAWPEPSLRAVLAHDPFAPPDWTRPPGELGNLASDSATDGNQHGSSASRQLLAELHSTGVSLVMISGKDRRARIGQMEVREGDQIGGFVVQEINSDGVVLIEHQAP